MRVALNSLTFTVLLSACFTPVDLGGPDGGGPDGGGADGGGSSDGGPALQRQLPGVVLVVDRSGSLASPVDPSDPRCQPGCGPGNPCAASCPTRASELRAGLDTALAAATGRQRFGLLLFPHVNGGCFPADSFDVSPTVPPHTSEATSALGQATTARHAIANFVANGGTPTAATLSFALTIPPEDARTVVVVSDGVPNCNDQNPNNTCAGANPACQCTLGPLSACQNAGSMAFQPCSHGCLDVLGVTSAAAQFVQRGQRVFFILLGADLGADLAQRSYDEFARAGGTTITCANGTDAECQGHGTCDPASRTCTRSHYTVHSAQQLSAALSAVLRQAR